MLGEVGVKQGCVSNSVKLTFIFSSMTRQHYFHTLIRLTPFSSLIKGASQVFLHLWTAFLTAPADTGWKIAPLAL